MEIGTDGSQTGILNIPGGGSACPTTPENVEEKLASLSMAGREVFKLAVNAMKRAAETVISEAGLTADDIAQVIPHQRTYASLTLSPIAFPCLTRRSS